MYLKKLFSSLFSQNDSKFFHCEIFQLNKHVRNSYPNQPYKSSQQFSTIHNDIWGTSRVKMSLALDGPSISLMITLDLHGYSL